MAGRSEVVHFSPEFLLSLFKHLLLGEYGAGLSADRVHEGCGKYLEAGAPPTNQHRGSEAVTVPTTQIIPRQLQV